MKITVERFRSIQQGALLAACTVSLASDKGEPVLDIAGVKIMGGREGRFVSMPAEKGRDQKWYPLVYIKHKDLKDAIERAVLEDYERRTSRHGAAPPAPAATPDPEPSGPACLT